MQRKKLIDVLIVVMTIAMTTTIVLAAYRTGYMTGLKNSPVTIRTLTMQQPPPEAKSITGQVVSVIGTTITLQAFGTSSTSPIANRQVSTTRATVFEQRTSKDPKVLIGELDVFSAKLQAARVKGENLPSSAYPTPYIVKKISLSDIHPGDTVVVTAAENILTVSQFTAIQVAIEGTPAGAIATSSLPKSSR